jgi:Baseplate J-like protein
MIMPIPLPELDDRRFEDLSEELRGLIPRHCPEWTDHNVSDPGITLLELFAWLGEALIYRLNRIPEKSLRKLLALLYPRDEPKPESPEQLLQRLSTMSLEEIRGRVLSALEAPSRVVTTADFETLVLDHFADSVARVRPLADLDLEDEGPGREKPGHVSIIVVPCLDTLSPEQEDELCSDVFDWLDERRLITCRLHVTPPGYVQVALSARVFPRPGFSSEALKGEILRRLNSFFAPVDPAAAHGGWPFGKDVHISEVCAEIEGTQGVDHVEDLALLLVQPGEIRKQEARIEVPANSLVRFDLAVTCIEVSSSV